MEKHYRKNIFLWIKNIFFFFHYTKYKYFSVKVAFYPYKFKKNWFFAETNIRFVCSHIKESFLSLKTYLFDWNFFICAGILKIQMQSENHRKIEPEPTRYCKPLLFVYKFTFVFHYLWRKTNKIINTTKCPFFKCINLPWTFFYLFTAKHPPFSQNGIKWKMTKYVGGIQESPIPSYAYVHFLLPCPLLPLKISYGMNAKTLYHFISFLMIK